MSGGRLRFAESTIYPGTFELARVTGMNDGDGVIQGASSFEVKLDIAAGSADLRVSIGDGVDSSASYSHFCAAVSGVVRLVFESQPDTSVEVTDYTSGSPVTSTISIGTVDGHEFRLQEIEIYNADDATQVDYIRVTTPGHTDPVVEPSSTWVNLVKCVEL